MSQAVYHLAPLEYIHVLDNNSNVTRVELGPQTFTRKDHEQVVKGPNTMIIVPPRHYCIVKNPVSLDANGDPLVDAHKNIKVRFGDTEIRKTRAPFPLYPNESLIPIAPTNKYIVPLMVIPPLQALVIKVSRDYEIKDAEGKVIESYVAGQLRLFEGPGTYEPRVAEVVQKTINAQMIGPGQALPLKAITKFTDRTGVERKAGEEWLWRETGAYIPGVDEIAGAIINAEVLTDTKAIHLRATRTFEDHSGTLRKAGDQWIVTNKDTALYIPEVHETITTRVDLLTLSSRHYAVIVNPVDPKTGKQMWGRKELRKGETTFFLQPNEALEKGIQDVNVLGFDEALLLRATQAFKEGDVEHAPGDLWLIRGPCEYIPPIEVEIVEPRKFIPLEKNEGIYVRNIQTGKVRVVRGKSYLLQAHEVKWSKDLPPTVESLLIKASGTSAARDKTRLVTYRAPHNSAVQIYDYKEKKSRVIFGPKLVTLGPEEHFTVLSLSGGKPKRPHVIKDLKLHLGPDFMTDFVIVETGDHAKLKLKLSYNWHFQSSKDEKDPDAAKIFQVPDFVGDACKAIASSVRAVVAMHSFDEFHKKSAHIIRSSVFGVNAETGKINENYVFKANGLIITNIDIQSVEPVDPRTKDSLQKSVQLAIEITTKSQEAKARHEAQRAGQEARGKLDRQKLEDEAKAEEARKELIQLEANSAIVESTGQAMAEAQAKAKIEEIQAKTAVKMAELQSEARAITAKAELEMMEKKNASTLEYKKALDALELERTEAMADIEADKFKKIITAIGPDTIKAISRAGTEARANMLKGLGLKSFMITDGKSPINLFKTANGLIGPGAAP